MGRRRVSRVSQAAEYLAAARVELEAGRFHNAEEVARGGLVALGARTASPEADRLCDELILVRVRAEARMPI